MGLIANTLRALMPEHKTAIGASVPMWQQGVPQYQQQPFLRYAREGYGNNEVVYACIEELATSAAEPRLAAFSGGPRGTIKIPEHPILDLLERPNPFMDRFTFLASIIMYLNIAGNAYIEKVRSRATNVVELWLLRPDRIRVIPSATKYIAGYLYEWGDVHQTMLVDDIIHLKMRNPFDDFYGLPPLAVISRRTDTDNWMREFTRSFFTNSGVPAGLLNIKQAVDDSDRERIRARFRNEFSGVDNWHSLMVLDDMDASFTPMGMPMGQRGLVLPELDEINETRLAMVFGVPLQLINARLASLHANRATSIEARRGFWDETLSPLYEMIASFLNLGLVPEYTDVTRLEFDRSTIPALLEDEDAKHKRLREDMLAGVVTREEVRVAIGREPDVTEGTWILSAQVAAPVSAKVATELASKEPAALAPPPAPNNPSQPSIPAHAGKPADTTPVIAGTPPSGNGHAG